jgi:hypothetical protein
MLLPGVVATTVTVQKHYKYENSDRNSAEGIELSPNETHPIMAE